MKFELSKKTICVLCVSFVIFTLTTKAQRTQPDLSQLEADVREQIKHYQDALAMTVKDPQSTPTKLADAYGALGEIYQAYSLNAPARESYLNATKLSPKDFRWIYLLAKIDQLEGHVDDAIQRFRIVASLQPDFIPVLVNLGNVYLELNRLDDARTSFASALQKETNNPAAYYGLGQVALSKRVYAEAVQNFEKALALAPEANRIHYALAMAYRGLRNSEKTKLHLTQQGTVGVRVADPLMDRLQALVQGARIHLVRGKIALEAKRYEEAAAQFRRAIEAEPNSVPAHINLGAALTQLRDLKGAAEQFEKALLIDPNNVNAHYNLAVLLANEKKHEQAIVHLEKVSSLHPTDLGARFFLSQQLLHVNRGEEALKLANSLYSSNDSLPYGLLVLSALLKLRRCDEAAALQQKLIAKAVEERNEEQQAKLKSALCHP
jgi:tetratricopeptide (TPR) repeat protein